MPRTSEVRGTFADPHRDTPTMPRLLLLLTIGVAAGATVALQSIINTALIIDTLGLFGAPRIEITFARILGLLLLLAGAFLLRP